MSESVHDNDGLGLTLSDYKRGLSDATKTLALRDEQVEHLVAQRDEHQKARASLAYDTVGLNQKIRQLEATIAAQARVIEAERRFSERFAALTRDTILVGRDMGVADWSTSERLLEEWDRHRAALTAPEPSGRDCGACGGSGGDENADVECLMCAGTGRRSNEN